MSSSEQHNEDEKRDSKSSYDKVFNQHFIPYCAHVHQSLSNKTIIKTNHYSDNKRKTNKHDIINCALLSKWIYDTKGYRPLLANTPLSIKSQNQSGGNETTDWAFCINKTTKTGYIVFRGTSGESLGIDVLTDISIVPTPIWCGDDHIIEIKDDDDEWMDKRNNHHHRWDFAVHGGIYSSVLRIFGKILPQLRKYKQEFNKLFITGHSLGGGLSILFGLELLLRNIIPKHIKCSIITFAAPLVISCEYPIKTHRPQSQLLLTNLHSMTHNFVNKFDIVPRIPSPWIMEILLPAIPALIKGVVSNSLIGSGISYFSRDYINTMKQQFIKHEAILSTFKPFGTYYILLHDEKKNFYIIDDSADNGVVKQILSFIPPVLKTETNEKDILAHYYYKAIIVDDIYKLDLPNQLIEQRSTEFDDNVWRITPSMTVYNKIWKFLFKSGDLMKLVHDHYIDDYLEGLIPNDYNDTELRLKMLCLKLFTLENKCGEGKSFWSDIDDKEYVYDSKIGVLKLQYHVANDQHAYVKNLTAMIRSVAKWSNHSDSYRLVLKSSVFTDDSWKEVDHSNNVDVLKSKFGEMKEGMQYWLQNIVTDT